MTASSTIRDAADRFAWIAAGGLLFVGACAGWTLERTTLDWQPARFPHELWRMWSAAFVHLSPQHLVANLAGTAVVTLFGVAARIGAPGAVAWLIAWPVTHVALLLQPELAHYAGLSGVLHAGVTVVATRLQFTGTGRQRIVAALTLAVVAAKIVHEAPWAHVVIHPPGWDIAVAPLAHATGAVAGIVAVLGVQAARHLKHRHD